MAAAAPIPGALPLTPRITKELARLQASPPPGVLAYPMANNPRHLDVFIAGPADSCFQGGIFHVELFLPADYPMVPPKIHFLTKIYHPNVDRVGRICLDILKDNWSPALLVDRVCLSLQQLMGSPNPDDPLDNTVADHWKRDLKGALATAKAMTQKYASQQPARAQPANRGPIPRSFQLRMELEKAEKDRENKAVQSPHAAFVSVGLGQLNDVSYARQLEDWNATIIGCPGTRTDGRIYNLALKCGPNYPEEPPQIRFLDKIVMPGIDERGNVSPQLFVWNTAQLPGMLGALCQIRDAMSRVNKPQPPEGATY